MKENERGKMPRMESGKDTHLTAHSTDRAVGNRMWYLAVSSFHPSQLHPQDLILVVHRTYCWHHRNKQCLQIHGQQCQAELSGHHCRAWGAVLGSLERKHQAPQVHCKRTRVPHSGSTIHPVDSSGGNTLVVDMYRVGKARHE